MKSEINRQASKGPRNTHKKWQTQNFRKYEMVVKCIKANSIN